MAALAMTFTLAVSVGLPLGALFYLLVRRRVLLRPFLAGVGTFLLFQLLLRIPLLDWLRGWDGLALLAFRSPWLYALFLALTAALFEEGGRYLAARLLLKGRTGCGEAMAFGLGHWGLEALALVGLPLLLSLLAAPGLTLAAGAGGLLAAGVEGSWRRGWSGWLPCRSTWRPPAWSLPGCAGAGRSRCWQLLPCTPWWTCWPPWAPWRSCPSGGSRADCWRWRRCSPPG
ncbi:Putative membrane peptidase family [Bittarella massiliensis (ex Durand et al. 2017)]|uniref:Membrane peptidase family n=1 Tax=Bittarella massiliensis (ex Durand et al. 2017) TaxID=1720313 RepID=A0AAQ1MDJ8_9FIRM|nr:MULTISPECIES: YhfC family glutamic-type intramembrane protease [Eubacteriales]ERI97265.1 hypothetical protein HMPREF0262_03292 [Clostridium sp. ATCC 29733]SHG14652.1 Putative membrane peptidase family [Bittarella massiliensis (ex Durand et al. 2017)]